MKSPVIACVILAVLSLIVPASLRAGPIAELYGGTGAGGNGTNQGALISIDPTTYAGTIVSDPTGDVFSRGISGLAFDNNGTTLYASLVGANLPFQLLTLDAMTGNTLNTVLITNTAGNLQIQDLTTNPLTNILYGVAPSSGDLYTIDKLTGVATLIGSTGAIRSAIAFDAAGGLWQTTNADELVQIDPLTGMRIGSATMLTQFYNGFTILQDGRFLGVLGDDQNGGIWNITGGNESLLGNSGINTLGDLASRFASAPTAVPDTGSTVIIFGGALLTMVALRFFKLRPAFPTE